MACPCHRDMRQHLTVSRMLVDGLEDVCRVVEQTQVDLLLMGVCFESFGDTWCKVSKLAPFSATRVFSPRMACDDGKA
jgi:hypothetical protein